MLVFKPSPAYKCCFLFSAHFLVVSKTLLTINFKRLLAYIGAYFLAVSSHKPVLKNQHLWYWGEAGSQVAKISTFLRSLVALHSRILLSRPFCTGKLPQIFKHYSLAQRCKKTTTNY